jgi:hypothetical protein
LFPDALQAFGGVAEDAKAIAGVGGSVSRLRTENRATRLVQSSSLMPARARDVKNVTLALSAWSNWH